MNVAEISKRLEILNFNNLNYSLEMFQKSLKEQ